MNPIRRVAVLGAGTMGARIAAHFANAGVPALALDVTKAATDKGIQAALKGKPGAFFVPGAASLITTGSFDADLEKIRECDWVLEAVTEDLGVKRALWTRVAGLRSADSIVSTNTSGIPLAAISEGFRRKFSRALSGHAFLQSAALSALDGTDSRGRRHVLNCSGGLRLCRPAAGQRRGAVQGHAELHRQPHWQFLRFDGPEFDGGGRSTPSKKWTRSPDR